MSGANENARCQSGADTSPHFTPKNSALRGFKQHAKQFIVALALSGLIPFIVAEWLIQHGGLRHE